MIKKVVLWILVIGCMATIFGFSSQVAEESKKTSSSIITKVIETLDVKNKLTESQKENMKEDLTFVVRKGAHFSIYAILGILVFLLAREYRLSVKKSVLTAISVSFIYACSDEFHQTFVDGRSGELRDIIIDTAGATFGCMVIMLFKNIVNKCKNRGRH